MVLMRKTMSKKDNSHRSINVTEALWIRNKDAEPKECELDSCHRDCNSLISFGETVKELCDPHSAAICKESDHHLVLDA